MSNRDVIFVDIKTPEDFLKVAGLLSSEQWIYRGHGDAKWTLRPTLERLNDARHNVLEKKQKNEKRTIIQHYLKMQLNNSTTTPKEEYIAVQLFKARAHCKEISDIEALCRMQHFGAPTRLLDFTFSIYVALYFAFEERYSQKDRCIWAIRYDILKSRVSSTWDKYYRERGIKPRDIINATDEERDRLSNEYYEDMLSDAFVFNNACVEIANKQIKDSPISTSQSDIIPLELPGENERIDAQNGLFLFPTTFKSFEENLCKSLGLNDNPLKKGDIHYYSVVKFSQAWHAWNQPAIVKMVFKHKDMDSAESLLRMSNVSTRSIYPGVEGIAKSIW